MWVFLTLLAVPPPVRVVGDHLGTLHARRGQLVRRDADTRARPPCYWTTLSKLTDRHRQVLMWLQANACWWSNQNQWSGTAMDDSAGDAAQQGPQ